jgi:glycosyltransferase involved in cell wall biosynthesis
MAGNIELLGEEVFRPFFDNNIPVVHYLGLTNPGYGKDLIPNHSSYHVVLASHWLADYFSSENYRFTRSSVIYPGARVDEFYLPIQPAFDTPRIIIAGMVAPHKGVSVLIQALAMLHHYGSKFSCTIAGAMPDQRYIEKLQQFIDQHGMADKIRFTGELSRQQLLNEFATHNILVFPSVVAETFGISQVEAMAAGLLVVSTATGGASEIIQDEKTGLVIKHNDVAALTLCLRTALDDPQHCCEIARAGQLVARDRFDIRQSVTDLEQLYIRLLPA